jgi:hypothetical protein
MADEKEAILRRRALFVAAALAGVATLVDGCANDGPQVCLSPVQKPDAGQVDDVDAGKDDAGEEDAG